MFDSLGEPLPGGTLSLDRLLEDGTEEPRGTIYFQIRKDGRFRKTGLRSGRYRIRLWENKTFERIVELGAGETRRLELQLPAGE